MPPSSPASALGHLRVLDLTGALSQSCARTLADLGADVVKIEPPEGDPLRHQGPFLGGIPGPDRSLPFIVNNRGKRSVVLDLRLAEDVQRLRELAAGADVLIEDFAPGYLAGLGVGYAQLREENPGLVYVSITPFGQTGPHAQYQGGELVAQATGGILWANGDDARRPCMAPFDLLSQIACLHAAFGALAALRARRITGHGQHVDVSRQEVVLYVGAPYIPRYAYQNEIARREGPHFYGGINTFQCADGGYVNLAPFMAHHFARLAKDVMGHPVLSDPKWAPLDARRKDREVVDQSVTEYAATVRRDSFVEAGQKAGVPIVALLTPEEFITNLHTQARQFFQEVEQPGAGRFLLAGAPARLGATPWRVDRPAPTLGQHTHEILDDASKRSAARKTADVAGHMPPTVAALDGTRITDFTRAVAGPLSTMFLAFFGAEDIKIESSDLDDNRNPGQAAFPELHRGKLSCTIDTRTAEGKDVLKTLVAGSDAVVENFRPGVMDRLGLDYEHLRAVKPDLVMLSMPGFGNSGPFKDYYSYGQQVMGMTGLAYLWGHPDSPINARVRYAFPDYVAAITGSLAVLAALEHRDETGEGQYIELAQVESLAHLLPLAYLEYTELKRAPRGQGNWSENAAPHDVYPCLGHDAWVAIEVHDDQQWAGLMKALGNPSWAKEDRFRTLRGRVEHKADLDRFIGQWTAQFTPRQIEKLLQKAGVPAGVAATAEDLYYDPHLRARRMIVSVQHPGYGLIEHAGVNVHLTHTPGHADGPAPAKGQHTDYVLTKLLGITDAERERLAAAGALR